MSTTIKTREEIEKIKDLIKQTGQLTFHLVASEEAIKEYTEKDAPPPGYVWNEITHEQDGKKTKERLLIHEKADFSGNAITNATVGVDQDGVHSIVKINLKSASRTKFARLTRDHVGERLAIVMDVNAEKGGRLCER